MATNRCEGSKYVLLEVVRSLHCKFSLWNFILRITRRLIIISFPGHSIWVHPMRRKYSGLKFYFSRYLGDNHICRSASNLEPLLIRVVELVPLPWPMWPMLVESSCPPQVHLSSFGARTISVLSIILFILSNWLYLYYLTQVATSAALPKSPVQWLWIYFAHPPMGKPIPLLTLSKNVSEYNFPSPLFSLSTYPFHSNCWMSVHHQSVL